jgi:hypothetical protein
MSDNPKTFYYRNLVEIHNIDSGALWERLGSDCILVDDDQFVKVAYDPDAFMQVLPGEAIQGDLSNEFDDLT